MKRSIFALALAAILPLSAQADALSYRFVEAGYTEADIAGADGNGYFAGGTVAFNETFYGSASYRNLTNDELGFDVSLDETVLSLGYRQHISDDTDLFAEVGYVNVGVDIDTYGNEDVDGWRVGAGFRRMLSPKFEGNIKGYYTHLSSELEGGEYGAKVGLVYHVNPTWGITGSFDTTKLLEEKINLWGVGVRASF